MIGVFIGRVKRKEEIPHLTGPAGLDSLTCQIPDFLSCLYSRFMAIWASDVLEKCPLWDLDCLVCFCFGRVMKSAPLPPCQVRQVRQVRQARQARQAPHRYVRWGLPLAAAVLILLVWPIPLPSWNLFEPLDIPVAWDEIVPSQELKYHNCGDEFQCARLEVPMDYQRTDGKGRTFALAVVRLPAKVPVTDPRYGGAVLINPGE